MKRLASQVKYARDRSIKLKRFPLAKSIAHNAGVLRGGEHLHNG